MNAVFQIIVGSNNSIGALLAETIEAAARTAGIDGFTLTRGVGWHVKWGAEPVAIIETCTSADCAKQFVSILCADGTQECAYVTVNGGHAALWYADGRQETIHPIDSDAAEFLTTVRPERRSAHSGGRDLLRTGYASGREACEPYNTHDWRAHRRSLSTHDEDCDCVPCQDAGADAGYVSTLPRKPAVY